MRQLPAEQIDGRSEFRDAVEKLTAQTKEQIALYSPRLPAWLYASEGTIEFLKRWILGCTRARVRIVIHEPRYAVAEPHRLIHLGQQLSSYFEFRDAPTRLEPSGDVLIVDDRHLLQKRMPDSTVASLWMDAPLRAREARREFDKLWEESTPSIEIRSQRL